ncbi:hypothetical protein WME75_01460 [Sorangium sp. So ce1014]|uniref:hypothetical protein n=1 Tax=Sorangium sp. So ce1014 TaxID=3133326 RepID=UPI003F633925
MRARSASTPLKLPRSIEELLRRSPVLFMAAVAHVALLVVLLGVAPLDARLVLGVNPWIKPAKFAASIAIYLLTINWLIGDVTLPPRGRRAVVWGTVAMVSFEMIAIAMQAARGVASHFNRTTPFDVAVFALMGIAILVNTALAAYLAYRFWTTRPPLPAPYLWGIRLGFLLFLLACAEGGFMSTLDAHSVGVADGGPGLPIVNWSTRGGDLRTAHFFGMHALQAAPLFGYWLSAWASGSASRTQRAVRWVVAFGVGYGAVALGLFLAALAGQPLIRM